MDKKIYDQWNALSDEIFEKTGYRLDVDGSIRNLNIAAACEEQRQNSPMPEIPVISRIEIEDREVFDAKLDNFNSDYFFFLKEQEEEFDNYFFPSNFIAEDSEMVQEYLWEAYKEELLNWMNSEVLMRWLDYAEYGDKIRVRRKLPSGPITGVVYKEVDGETQEIATDEYVMVLQYDDTDELFNITIKDAYPV